MKEAKSIVRNCVQHTQKNTDFLVHFSLILECVFDFVVWKFWELAFSHMSPQGDKPNTILIAADLAVKPREIIEGTNSKHARHKSLPLAHFIRLRDSTALANLKRKQRVPS